MADVKIASLTAATTPTDTDIMIIEDNSDTKKITFANIKSVLKTYFDSLYGTIANLNLKAPLDNPTFTGVVTASQIKFPATQVPSADPNTLDDYEEGTWTPIPVPATGTITSYASSGNYTKIGNVVTIMFHCFISDAGTGAGTLAIIGLPFASLMNYLGIFGSEPFQTGAYITGYIINSEIRDIVKLIDNTSIIGTGCGPSMKFTYLTN